MTPQLRAAVQLIRFRDPLLARQVERAASEPRLTTTTARSGHIVPGLLTGGAPRWFHSVYDPTREAGSIVQASGGAPYLVCLGLGGAYHVEEALSSTSVERLLIVERDAGMLRALLESVDMSPVLRDPRVFIALCPNPADLASTLQSDYLPALWGGLGELRLRGREEAESDYFAALKLAMNRGVEVIRGDFAVQARFGRRWIGNLLRNLPAIEGSPSNVPSSDRVVIAAAGPSLDDQYQRLRETASGSYLLAVDTALPALQARGFRPHGVISIDCQHISYQHFRRIDAGTPVFLDVCSPPAVVRRVDTPVFLRGGHPMSAYLAQRWRSLPPVDTSGGNVAHAALSLACSFGAQEIELLGVDLCYPRYAAYARGTYLHHWIQAESSRPRPVHHALWDLCAAAPGVRGTRGRTTHHGPVYTTHTMGNYRERIELFSRTAPARIVQYPGRCPPLNLASTTPTTPRRQAVHSIANREPWTGMLRGYQASLDALDLANRTGWSTHDAGLAMTLLPLTAWILGRRPGGDHRQALVDARNLTCELARQALNAHAS